MIDKELDEAILSCMQKTWNHPQYKSEGQGQAMRAVLRNESPLTVVLPTGGGKSLLFMLLALLEPWGTTLVIVLFVSLIEDMLKRS